jgi:putative addiction module component (TIGR02574 family)
MTVREKLAVMETLWDDLSRSPKTIESPDWHKQILDERQQKIAEGTAQFVSWDAAKAAIRKKLSED